jgi:uncharacterized protein (DUF952 family)/uncharacterized protein (DUF1330 family)
MMILKIFRAEEWQAFRAAGETLGAPIDLADGFIHFSTPSQAAETAAKHFAGAEDLVLVGVEEESLGDALKWEVSRGGALFPHLYRALHLRDVARVEPLPLVAGVHVFPEDLVGHVDPARPQFELFKNLPRDHPIEMLNLVRLRAQAAYPAGHNLLEAGLSGREAYARYGAESASVLARVGGHVLWRGEMEAMLIGPTNERWDHAFIARYPTAHAFLDMLTDPAYRDAVIHRQAGVATSRLIRCTPAEAGGGFA